MPAPVRVPRTQLARDGDVVTVRLGVGADLLPPGGLVGEVTGSLGRPGDPSQDVLAIVFGHGFSQEFPPEVMDEADRIPLHVPATELHEGGRRDLRALSLVTIDGADARDFDDAVYAEDQPGGAVRLWVAIADVSHYVRPGSALDTEAFRRGTSVYLPDRVLPMLPERLSNGICSLRPDEDRLCLVAEMVFDASGRRTQTELYPAVMRSAARCTYEEVQQVLDGESLPARDRFRPLFQRLQTLGRLLRGVREQRGAIDFDLPETRPQLDESGRPVRMVRRERKESHRIVEDCMLAANEAVAAFFQEQGLPSVYRFHGEPDPDKLSTFSELARAHGLMVPGKGEPTSRELNLFMRGLVGHPGQRALNQLLLRSMMQAVYSPDQVGHYGLGAEEYLHFTSPIRRYPDLLVHRLLRAQWERRQRARPERELENEVEELRRMAAHSSERERAAMKCEREVNSLYACLLMEDRVGEEFAATVSSITDFGFFVELDTEHVEGLVPGGRARARARARRRRAGLADGPAGAGGAGAHRPAGGRERAAPADGFRRGGVRGRAAAGPSHRSGAARERRSAHRALTAKASGAGRPAPRQTTAGRVRAGRADRGREASGEGRAAPWRGQPRTALAGRGSACGGGSPGVGSGRAGEARDSAGTAGPGERRRRAARRCREASAEGPGAPPAARPRTGRTAGAEAAGRRRPGRGRGPATEGRTTHRGEGSSSPGGAAENVRSAREASVTPGASSRRRVTPSGPSRSRRARPVLRIRASIASARSPVSRGKAGSHGGSRQGNRPAGGGRGERGRGSSGGGERGAPRPSGSGSGGHRRRRR